MASERSKIELKGFFAKYYDLILNLITLGGYSRIINNAIEFMNLKKGEKVLDLGCGSGKNDILILKKMEFEGEVVGVDISEEMLKNAKRREMENSNYKVIKRRIEEELPFDNEFDHVFLSFVIHGFEDWDKEKILKNAYKSLKNGGYLNILDYSEFDLSKANPLIKIFLKRFECPLASEFIKLDLSEFVKPFGFETINEHLIASHYIRLFIAQKI